MTTTAVADMLAYIAAAPTPFHCVAETRRRLEAAGFSALDERDRWSVQPGEARFAVRGGSLLAFRVGTAPAHEAGFRLLSAHTDSPNLRLKPAPDLTKEGYQQLGVETYGGTQDWSWVDRDLGVAGQVVVKGDAASGAPLERRLVCISRPILRIPSLAIHLNRSVNDDGLKLNRQTHLPPVLALAPPPASDQDRDPKDDVGALKRLLAAELALPAERILAWELMLFDLLAPTLGGWNEEFVFSARLDNQAMCHAALQALAAADAGPATQVVCLYDHEEIGSASASGAAGAFAEDVLRRLAESEGPGAEPGALPRAAQRSWQISADMAHAVHPNYADQSEAGHRPRLNGGPVIKVNVNQRYATSAETAAIFEACCQAAEVPVQRFVTRSDLPCGSTIGPISATRLGIPTVDVGNAMLSMHSIREQCGAADQPRMIAAMGRFLAEDCFF